MRIDVYAASAFLRKQCHCRRLQCSDGVLELSAGVGLELKIARYLTCLPCRRTGQQRDAPRDFSTLKCHRLVGGLLNHAPCHDRLRGQRQPHLSRNMFLSQLVLESCRPNSSAPMNARPVSRWSSKTQAASTQSTSLRRRLQSLSGDGPAMLQAARRASLIDQSARALFCSPCD